MTTAGESPDERFVDEEEDAAGAEAGAIGGRRPDYEGDEAERPLEESGEGESEGFEEAERELIEAAEHGEGRVSPETDAFTPEQESDEATAAYGEPDEEEPPDA